MLKPTQCFRLGLRPYPGSLYWLQSYVGELTRLVWVFFPTILRWLSRRMSAIQKKAFFLRSAMAALAVNSVYAIASYAFYFGGLPGRIVGPIADLIIGPFRSIFAFSPIGWAVSLGAEVSGPTMVTPLVSVHSWEQYTIALIIFSCTFAIITEASFWRMVRTSMKRLLHGRTCGTQLKLDKFVSRYVRTVVAAFFFGSKLPAPNIEVK